MLARRPYAQWAERREGFYLQYNTQLSICQRAAQSWVALTPEGYFNASGDAAKHINVRVGDRVSSVDQFYPAFFRPELVRLALAGERLPAAQSLPEVASRRPAPTVVLESPASGTVTAATSVELKVRVLDNGGGIGDVAVHLNGTQVANDGRDVAVKAKDPSRERSLSFTLPLARGRNEIKVTASNGDGSMESAPAQAVVECRAVAAKPRLHALVIGIDKYKNDSIALKYSAADARAFAEALAKAAGPLFDKPGITLLTSVEETSKESIEKAFADKAASARPDDLFVFYDASHGSVDSADGKELYYLLTSDVRLLSTRHLAESAFSHEDLIKLLGAVPAQKKLVILDTCHAGKGGTAITAALLASRGLTEATAVKLLQHAVGSTVFSSASDSQQALEGYQGHGLFTFALLEGLSGKADLNKDGFLKVAELADYVEEEVVEISEKDLKRQQNPVIQIGANFPLGKVPAR